MLFGGCIFVDNGSGFVSIKHQVVINSTENSKDKLNFESDSKIQGGVIKGYHNKNGVLNAS